MSKWEVRTTHEPLHLRQGPRGDMFVGYAFRYGRLSENLGGFVERVAPGAATKTIQEQDLRALFNHHPDKLLGRMGAGTLRVVDGPVGLSYEIDKPDTTLGRDLATLIGRGDIYGSSWSFMTVGARGQAWLKTESGMPLREIRQMRMRDLGPVTFPAYSDSDVALRSLADARSLPFEEVIAAAASGQLSELVVGLTRFDGHLPSGCSWEDVHHGDHGTQEASRAPVVHARVQGRDRPAVPAG